MPDEELASLIREEETPLKKSPSPAQSTDRKTCPYCSANILVRAQRCKICGGNVRVSVLQNADWENEPVMDGQAKLLRMIGTKPAKSMTAGQAAELISSAREENPGIFKGVSASAKRKSSRKSGKGGFIIFLLLVAGAGFAALKITGRLDDTIDRVKQTVYSFIPRNTEDIVIGDDSPAPRAPSVVNEEDSGPVVSVGNEPTDDISEKESVLPPPGRKKTVSSEENPLAAKFRREHTAPKTGAAVYVGLKSGGVLQGKLKEVNKDSIVVQRGMADVTLPRKQLSDESRACFYVDDYVAYRLFQNRLYLARAEKARQYARKWDEKEADRNAKASEFRSRTYSKTSGPTSAHDKGTTSAGATSGAAGNRELDDQRVASGEMSMAEWMKKYNKNNARLMARQKRVSNYEKKASEEGLAY